VPKLGMGSIRREQICRAATVVIARAGFSGTTMRSVADEAGVSTGMLNHYFENRQDLLTQALLFLTERTEESCRHAIEGVPPGARRLTALLDAALSDENMARTWRVWIDAYAEALRRPELRPAIEARWRSWGRLVDCALEDIAPPRRRGTIAVAARLDAVLSGLVIRSLTSETPLGVRQIRDEVIRATFGTSAAAQPGRRRVTVSR
jgi:TetR/AcrR family transcriptional regulator, transcriptional repressor of bet genes